MIYEPKGRALEYSLLAVNHYRGCAHGCTYCYARNILKKSGIDFDCPRLPAEDFIKKLKRSALKYANTDNRCLLSFTTDPYQPLDDKYNFTREVLSILKLNNIPFQVLTKGGKRATKDFDLYGKYDAFATTMTFLDPGESQRYEPNAALPASRIEAIDEAHRRGIETWVSLEPVIEPSQSLKIIEICHPIVSLFKIGILNHVANKTDWRKFGIAAIELCEKFGKPYYVKEDLAKHLTGIKYTSTDTRLTVPTKSPSCAKRDLFS